MRIHGGGPATSAQSNPNGSNTIFKVRSIYLNNILDPGVIAYFNEAK